MFFGAAPYRQAPLIAVALSRPPITYLVMRPAPWSACRTRAAARRDIGGGVRVAYAVPGYMLIGILCSSEGVGGPEQEEGRMAEQHPHPSTDLPTADLDPSWLAYPLARRPSLGHPLVREYQYRSIPPPPDKKKRCLSLPSKQTVNLRPACSTTPHP